MLRHVFIALIAVSCLLSLTACGDDDGGGGFNLSGAYTITSWTENIGACDIEGVSIKETQTDTLLFADMVEQNFGVIIRMIMAGTCTDPQACSDMTNAGIFGGLTGASVFETTTKEGDKWMSRMSSGYDNSDGTCTVNATKFLLSSPAEGELMLERIVYENLTVEMGVDDQGEPWCLDDAKIDAALAAASCTSYEVIQANNPQILPAPTQE